MNNYLTILYWTIFFANIINSSNVCNSDLLFSYGIENPQYLNQGSIFCAGESTEICCTNSDLSQVLEEWNNRWVMTIQPFYELNLFLYKAIFQYYEDLLVSAKFAYINPTMSLECRSIAEDFVLSYIDEDDIKKFLEEVEKTNFFLMEIRRGFFCSLCNVKNQKYFDTDLKKINFSFDSCEDLVKFSIRTIAFRVNKVLPILAKLNKHLNCLLKNDPQKDDKEFAIEEEILLSVNSCFEKFARTNGQTPVFDKCHQLCSRFSLVQPSEIIEGVIKPLVLIKDNIEKLNFNSTYKIFEELDEKKEYDSSRLEELFISSKLSFQDLSKYQINFNEYGIRPIDDAETSLFFYSPDSDLRVLEKSATIFKIGLLMFVAHFTNS